MGCFRLQRRSKSHEPPNKLLKMVAGLASSSSSREKQIMATKSSSSMSRAHAESSDSPNDGSSPRMSDFYSAPSSVWPESSPSRSPQSARASRGNPVPLPLPLKRQHKSQQQPLPLPKPTPAATSTSPKLSRIPSRPHPLPLPADHIPAPCIGLRSFDFEHMARLCRNFSPQCQIRAGSLGPVYRCSIIDDAGRMELDVVRITNHQDQVEEWMGKLKLMAQLEHGSLCKLIGFSVQAGGEGERLLVFESSGSSESVDKLLAAAGKNEAPRVLDWDARIKIALGAARGLAYLHAQSPLEVAYYPSFGSSSVLVDKDWNVKLVGYEWEEARGSATASQMGARIAPAEVSAKANVRSYGILLLELLTGKQQVERLLPQGRDLVQWARPFVNDSAKLSSILDPRLRGGQCPMRGVKDVANFALNCLYSDPRLRPTMREAASLLKALAVTGSKELLGRSATFSMRGPVEQPHLARPSSQYQARSAGASPARYASPLSAPFFSCSSSSGLAYEDMSGSRQRRRAQLSR